MAQKRALSNKKIKDLKSKQRKQDKLIHAMRRRDRWGIWIGAIIIILLLLGILMLGNAAKWWRSPNTGNRTGQFTPSSSSGQGTASGVTGTAGTAGTAGSGGNSTAHDSTTSTTTNNTNNTTKETTTTNTDSTSGTSTSNGSSLIQELLKEAAVGDNINSVKDQANKLGINVSCDTTTLVPGVQQCTFTSGNSKVTTNSLLSNGTVTSILP